MFWGAFWKLAVPCDHKFPTFFSSGLLACPASFCRFLRDQTTNTFSGILKKNSVGGFESNGDGGWAARVVPRERSCVIFFALVALVQCGIRCPGGRAVEIRGGHFWCVRLPFLPDLWFWISPSGRYSWIGTFFGTRTPPPGRSALALKMKYV